MAFEKLNIWKCHPPGHQMKSEFQREPLRIIFDVKKEDGRRKARHFLGSHAID